VSEDSEKSRAMQLGKIWFVHFSLWPSAVNV
jgi:hypothetical protein